MNAVNTSGDYIMRKWDKSKPKGLNVNVSKLNHYACLYICLETSICSSEMLIKSYKSFLTPYWGLATEHCMVAIHV